MFLTFGHLRHIHLQRYFERQCHLDAVSSDCWSKKSLKMQHIRHEKKRTIWKREREGKNEQKTENPNEVKRVKIPLRKMYASYCDEWGQNGIRFTTRFDDGKKGTDFQAEANDNDDENKCLGLFFSVLLFFFLSLHSFTVALRLGSINA